MNKEIVTIKLYADSTLEIKGNITDIAKTAIQIARTLELAATSTK